MMVTLHTTYRRQLVRKDKTHKQVGTMLSRAKSDGGTLRITYQIDELQGKHVLSGNRQVGHRVIATIQICPRVSSCVLRRWPTTTTICPLGRCSSRALPLRTSWLQEAIRSVGTIMFVVRPCASTCFSWKLAAGRRVATIKNKPLARVSCTDMLVKLVAGVAASSTIGPWGQVSSCVCDCLCAPAGCGKLLPPSFLTREGSRTLYLEVSKLVAVSALHVGPWLARYAFGHQLAAASYSQRCHHPCKLVEALFLPAWFAHVWLEIGKWFHNQNLPMRGSVSCTDMLQLRSSSWSQ